MKKGDICSEVACPKCCSYLVFENITHLSDCSLGIIFSCENCDTTHQFNYGTPYVTSYDQEGNELN